MPIPGICRLCGRSSELQDSHLLPKWVLRYVGAGDNPVRIVGNVAVQTSKQAKEHLLCFDCEQRFGRIENRARRVLVDGSPGVRDFLAKAPHPELGFRVGCLPAEPAGILSIFALRCVWMFSVHSIPSEKRLSLGPYQEHLRSYLAGETEALVNAAVRLISIESVDVANISLIASYPWLFDTQPAHVYAFLTNGVIFFIDLGRRIEDVSLRCSIFPGEGWFFEQPWGGVGALRSMYDFVRSARSVGKLARR